MTKDTAADILRRCDETLATARFGLADVKNSPQRRRAGIRNMVVFGRAVTNVLQNLRSIRPDFDSWYRPFKEEMERDPLMRYFYNTRSEILKEGNLNLGSYAHIKSLQLPQDIQKLGPPPPNAKSFFIGDQQGGSGWEVQMQDGTVEKYYVDLPSDKVKVGLYLQDAPTEHLGKTLHSKDIISLGTHYIGYLEKLLQEAKRVFVN